MVTEVYSHCVLGRTAGPGNLTGVLQYRLYDRYRIYSLRWVTNRAHSGVPRIGLDALRPA